MAAVYILYINVYRQCSDVNDPWRNQLGSGNISANSPLIPPQLVSSRSRPRHPPDVRGDRGGARLWCSLVFLEVCQLWQLWHNRAGLQARLHANAQLPWHMHAHNLTTSTHLERRVGTDVHAVSRADAETHVQLLGVPQVANAEKHCFQHAGLLIIDELLHHWQISPMSQGRARVHTWAHTHPNTNPDTHARLCGNTHTHMHFISLI